jgi:hypothetical protein
MLASLLRPFNRAASVHIRQLRATIDALFERLRNSIVHAVGEAVSGTVRRTLHAVLSAGNGRPMLDDYEQHRPARSLWGQGEPDDWDQEMEEPPVDADEELERDIQPTRSPPSPKRVHSALAAGCQVAAWSLRKAAGISTAIGAGVLTAAAALMGSPLVVAGVAVLSTLAGLMSLDSSILSAGTLAGF